MKKITKEQLAEILNGAEYRNEMSNEEIDMAKENGLVVVYGASDDLMEFEGAISDEFGTEAFFDKEGNQLERCDDDCPHSLRAFEKANKIEADYTSGGWVYTTEIPHAKFHIFEDNEVYCNAIIFSINDLK